MYYLLPIFLEYLVIINAYNGDLIPNFNEDFEYALMDIFVFIFLIMYREKDKLCWLLTLISFIAHIQWYVHNPFCDWPDWWIADKSPNDIRHRTEYYCTHVMCFSIYLVLYVRYLDKN